jgi:hypothetical protein
VKNTTPINTPKTRRESRMWLGKAAKVGPNNPKLIQSWVFQGCSEKPQQVAKVGQKVKVWRFVKNAKVEILTKTSKREPAKTKTFV